MDQSIFDAPYYVIDIFPTQIPAERGAAYFAAERFFHQEPHFSLLRQRFARLIIKIGCYHDIILESGDNQQENPSPEILYDTIINCKSNDYLTFFLPQQDAAITYSGDDLYMTLYNANVNLAKFTAQICGAEGLFFEGLNVNNKITSGLVRHGIFI